MNSLASRLRATAERLAAKSQADGEKAVKAWKPWEPLPDPVGRIHPQRWAIQCWKQGASEIFYGGAAGGGKTSFAVGQALTEHRRSLILRREGSQLEELIEQAQRHAHPGSQWKAIGNGGQLRTPDNRVIRFAGVPHDKDKAKFQGRPRDLLIFDEATEFPEPVVDFLSIWLRTTSPGLKTLLLLVGNPPTHTEGAWIVRRYAPWVDPTHPRPAAPGEIRYYVREPNTGDEIERPDASPVMYKGELYTPQGRTFIPALLDDNPMLDAEYASRLMKLPPAMREAFRFGNFGVSLADDPWQVCPTSWIRAAQERWKADGWKENPLSACGFDVAMGGEDKTCLTKRYANWFAMPKTWQGAVTDDSEKAVNLIVPELLGFKGAVNYDGIGIGAGCGPILRQKNLKGVPINFYDGGGGETDKATGTLLFSNLRALVYWRFREMLDPFSGNDIALPPHPDLLAELAAPKYEYRGGRISVKKKDEIKASLGRSPDIADSVVLAAYEAPVAPFFVGVM